MHSSNAAVAWLRVSGCRVHDHCCKVLGALLSGTRGPRRRVSVERRGQCLKGGGGLQLGMGQGSGVRA